MIHASDILHSFAESLRVPYGFERSVKLCHGRVLDQRYLLSLHKSSLGQEARTRLMALGERLNAPKDALAQLLEELPAADVVHLGFEPLDVEKAAGRALCKIYLEFANRARMAMAPSQPRPQPDTPTLVHKALKWQCHYPHRSAITYYWLKAATLAESRIKQQLTNTIESQPVADAVQQVVSRALQRSPFNGFMWLDVEESDSQRRSLDFNLYDADLKLQEIQSVITPLASHFRIAKPELENWFAANGRKALGHIAGGINREGEPFITIYFGVEECG